MLSVPLISDVEPGGGDIDSGGRNSVNGDQHGALRTGRSSKKIRTANGWRSVIREWRRQKIARRWVKGAGNSGVARRFAEGKGLRRARGR